MEEEKRRLEEQLLCIDRKKQVQGQESTYAHNVAQKYRLEQEHSHLIDQEIKNLKMEPKSTDSLPATPRHQRLQKH